jgi:hypothetical protein
MDRELILLLDKLERRVGTLESLQVAITPANPSGAVALQATTPGTAQTGNANVSGTVKADIVTATTKIQLNGVTVLENGTSFPGSPSTNQRFFRTDLGRDYLYDGTRWLSTQEYTLQLLPRGTQPFTAAGGTTANIFDFDCSIPGYNDTGWNGIYVTSFSIIFFSGTAQSGTNFYAVRLYALGGAGTVTLANNNTQNATVANTWTPRGITVTPLAMATTIGGLEMAIDQTGLPGNFFMYASVGFRKIG